MTVCKILFITHDTNRAGAPILLLRLMSLLKSSGYIVKTLIKFDNGPLKADFQKLGPCRVYYLPWRKGIFTALRRKFFGTTGFGYGRVLWRADLIFNNTITNGHLLKRIKTHHRKIKIVTYIHELEMVASAYAGKDSVTNTLLFSDIFLVPSPAVKDFLVSKLHVPIGKIELLYYYIPMSLRAPSNFAIKKQKGPEFVVGGSGTIDWRKGIDIFLQVAFRVLRDNPQANVKFKWKGGSKKSKDYSTIEFDLKKTGFADRILFEDSSSDMHSFYESIDLFLLTSREDPYPLVVLEAASWGVPTVCFKQSGGAVEFVGEDAGTSVDYLDVSKASSAVLGYYDDRNKLRDHGLCAKTKWHERHENKELIVEQFETALKAMNKSKRPNFMA